MASGHAYDSDGGRALAGAITSLMTGASYRRSAELAGVVGAYDGFAPQRQGATRAGSCASTRPRTTPPVPVHQIDRDIFAAAGEEWANGNKIGEKNGWPQRAGLGARTHRHHRP